jgi:hypothetical protein
VVKREFGVGLVEGHVASGGVITSCFLPSANLP